REREWLRGPGLLTIEIGRGCCALLDGEEWTSRLAIEEKHEATLGDLGDCIDASARARHTHEIGRRRQITIPAVVVQILDMPESSARFGVEGHQCVGEKDGVNSSSAVETRLRG